MSDVWSIERLCGLQDVLGRRDVHLVWVGDEGFTVAHTDDERANLGRAEHELAACELHRWLLSLDGPPESVGLYVAVPHEPDAYSEPLGAAPWDLEPLSLEAARDDS